MRHNRRTIIISWALSIPINTFVAHVLHPVNEHPTWLWSFAFAYLVGLIPFPFFYFIAHLQDKRESTPGE